MASQVCIKLRRRGMNYYTDYTEGYLESAFCPMGWHLTFRPEQAVWTCSIQWDSSPWLTFSADWLNTLEDGAIAKLAQHLGDVFKTISDVSGENPPENAEFVLQFHFTN